jgi:FkbM family methyltransferase
VRRIAARLLSGTAHCPFPDSEFQLFFDGYRNIGFGLNVSHFEEQEQRLVRQLLIQNRPKVLWDIGANIGIWSLFLTGLSTPDAEIRCFEPDPENLRLLQLNMNKNRIGNWVIRPVAVSDHEGSDSFYSDPVTGATGSLESSSDFIGKFYNAPRQQVPVQITTVDSEVASGARPPEFIKIDVEGHELAVLKGALKTLKETRPLLILETSHRHNEVSEFFNAIDYKLIDLEGRPVDSPQFNTIAIPREAELPKSASAPGLHR